MAKRKAPEVNAGSMADIAFLLLIFFLVTTQVPNEQGLLVKLPAWSEEPPINDPKAKRNVFQVLANANNELLIRDEIGDISSLRARVKEFIMNPQKREDLASSPKVAIVSIRNDRSTSYETYIQMYSEIKAAYTELWDEYAINKFGQPYEKLDKSRQELVDKEIPLVISEAEPSSYGK